MIKVTADELVEFVRRKGKFRLSTIKRQKPFTVELKGDGFEFVPQSRMKLRFQSRDYIGKFCDLFSINGNSYKNKDYYIIESVETSYQVALIKFYVDQNDLRTALDYKRILADGVQRSLADPAEARRERLASAAKFAEIRTVSTQIFLRNPDVVAEVLIRANGSCEECKKPAPFARKSDGRPYLEVHHRKLLAEGGEDTVENAIAMCPNCHRRAHHG